VVAASPVMDIPGVLECRIKQRLRALPAHAASCPGHCGCARRCSDESWSSAPRVSGGRCVEGEVVQRLEWASIRFIQLALVGSKSSFRLSTCARRAGWQASPRPAGIAGTAQALGCPVARTPAPRAACGGMKLSTGIWGLNLSGGRGQAQWRGTQGAGTAGRIIRQPQSLY